MVSVGLLAFGSANAAFASGSRHAAAGTPSDSGSQAVAYQEDPAHDGYSADPSFTAPLTKLWSATFPGAVWYPLIVGGTVLVDSAEAGYGTQVSALSLTDGNVIWGPKDIGGTYGFGGLTYDDGKVFALNYDGELTAFDVDTGAVDWVADLPGQYAFTSSPTASDGTVYVSGAGDGGTVYAVDESDGSVQWTQSVENGDSSAPAVDSTGVYVSYACEQAYSFTVDGGARWHHQTDCEGGGGRTDVLHDGEDYIRDDAGMGPAVLSESDGSVTDTFSSSTAPAFDGSTMATLSAGTISATDLTNDSVTWSSAASNYTIAPLMVNGYVVAGASTGAVDLLNERTGDAAWSGNAGDDIAAPDEHNAEGVAGMAEAHGELAVPAGDRLTVFGSSDLPLARITKGPTVRSFVGAHATFRFTSNVSDNPSYTCTLDGVAAPCTSPVTLTRLSDGKHRFSVAVAGETGPGDSQVFKADRLPPSVAVSPFAARFGAGGRIAASWAGADAESGLKRFQVRRQTYNDRGHTSAWKYPKRLTGITRTEKSIGVRPGSTVCLEVRATDRVGNRSRWSPRECTTALIDDRRLARSRGWYSGVSGSDLDHTFTGTDRRGATLALHRVAASRLAIVAAVCRTCGVITVSFGSFSRRLSLRSGRTGSRVFVMAHLPNGTRGSLVLRVSSKGRPVQIDGVGVDPR